VPENKATRSSIGYEARIAMFIGFCALCVAGYTAYMQRQQVRAQVWPILEFDSSNGPIRFTLANKGVGPAIIKHAIVKVDGEPVQNWTQVLDKLLGPPTNPERRHHYSESDMNSHVLSANESMDIMTPQDDDNKPVAFDRSNLFWEKLNDARFKVTVEICYCSTLGECWTLRAGGSEPSITTECRDCPRPSAVSFQQ
jgi:hypothetical protein